MTRAQSAAILAGGRAERLGGRTKGLLEVGGQRIIDRQLAVLGGLFRRIFLVTNEPALWSPVTSLDALGVVLVPDRSPGSGPLGGIDAALAALSPAEEPGLVVCVGGDMPFLDARALVELRDHPSQADALVPLVGGHAEPLFARYSRACLPAIAQALATRRFKTAALLDHVVVEHLPEAVLRAFEPDLRCLTNINTPADLAAARASAIPPD